MISATLSTSYRSPWVRRGLSLLESAFVILIITATLAGSAKVYNDYIKNDHRVQAANQMLYVSRAVAAHVSDHYAQLMIQAQSAGGGPIEVMGVLAQGVPLEDLRSIYQKGYRADVRVVTTTQGVPALQAMISTQGGEDMDEEDMLGVTRLVGTNAGYLDASGAWKSAMGNDDLDPSDYGVTDAHTLVVLLPMVDAGDLDSEGLFRSEIDGRDALNQMNTDLDMNGFSARNIETLTTDNIHANTLKADSAELAFGRSQRMDATQNVRAGTLEAQGDLRVKGTLTTRDIDTRGGDLDTRLSAGRLGPDGAVVGINQRGDANRQGGDLYTHDVAIAGDLKILPNGSIIPPLVTEGAPCSPNGSLGRYDDSEHGMAIVTCRNGVWGSNYQVSEEYRIEINEGDPIVPTTYIVDNKIIIPASEGWKECFMVGAKAPGNDEPIYNYIYPYVKTQWSRGLICTQWGTCTASSCDKDGNCTSWDYACCVGKWIPEPWGPHHATDIYDYANPVRVVDHIKRPQASACPLIQAGDGGWILATGGYQYPGDGMAAPDQTGGEGWGDNKAVGSAMCAWRCIK